MKLRYYMRGLGIGILVTAILMGITLDGKTEKLTDAQIIERAEALGMEQKYESTVLADAKSDEETEEEIVPEPEAKPEPEEETKAEQEAEAEVTPEAETEPEVKTQEIETDEPDEVQVIETDTAETVQITVQGGDGSQAVARKLAEVGLIEDIAAYDKFLCRNGYDKKICTGTHTIPMGAGDEEIAKIITSRAR